MLVVDSRGLWTAVVALNCGCAGFKLLPNCSIHPPPSTHHPQLSIEESIRQQVQVVWFGGH